MKANVLLLQAKDERNYHIFYEMLAGLPSQQKQAFYLQEAETYYYLNQVDNVKVVGLLCVCFFCCYF